MTANEVRSRLNDRNLKEVSRATGIGYMILWRFKKGGNCHIDVFLQIIEYLNKS